ncbi:MAG: ATP-binding protein [Anaerolineae bacterium]
MIISVASGKGGTGKTLLASGLAWVAAGDGAQVHLLDCDVEEPNAHLFLQPRLPQVQAVSAPVPSIDPERCNHCGHCARVCAFHALAVVREQVLVFPQLCHSCGSCLLQCEPRAITEVPRHIGRVELGRAGSIRFARGVMDVGQAMATPVIRELKRRTLAEANGAALVLLDAPPGNACPVVETVRGSDYVLLVTEPTPFGLHDLEIAVQTARDELGLPVGVVVNRDGVGDRGVEEFCARADIPILLRIPLDRRIAQAYSEGMLWVEALPEYRQPLRDLLCEVAVRVGGSR